VRKKKLILVGILSAVLLAIILILVFQFSRMVSAPYTSQLSPMTNLICFYAVSQCQQCSAWSIN